MVTKHKMKNTEIGFIPEDWDVKPLSDIGVFSKGFGITRDQAHSGNIPCIRYGEIYTSHHNYIRQFYSHISPEIANTATKLKTGDILFAGSGETKEEIGKAVAFVSSEDAYAGGDIIILSPKLQVSSQYLGFVLNNASSVKQKSSLGQGDAVVHIHAKELSGVLIPFPPYNEQHAIATVLSEIDTTILSLEQAITKKLLIKEGAMQRLLTGKVRLKGFKEPWVEKSMMEIGQTYNGITGKGKADFGHGNSRYITFLNILNNPSINLDELESVDIDPINDGQNEVRKGDLFFNTSSETPEDVGTCSTLMHDVENVYLNSFCFGFRLKDSEISGLFMSYYFRSAIGRREMATLAQGATRYNLSKDNFYKIVVTVPKTKEEQNAITKVLATMDSEISALEAERDKYISIKQGMMQKLLTGQIRLPQSCLKEE